MTYLTNRIYWYKYHFEHLHTHREQQSNMKVYRGSNHNSGFPLTTCIHVGGLRNITTTKSQLLKTNLSDAIGHAESNATSFVSCKQIYVKILHVQVEVRLQRDIRNHPPSVIVKSY